MKTGCCYSYMDFFQKEKLFSCVGFPAPERHHKHSRA